MTEAVRNRWPMISEDEFWDIWGVRNARNGELFELHELRRRPINHVWTIVESGDPKDENWYAMPGYHFVNRLGYVLTRKPWKDKTIDAVYFKHRGETTKKGSGGNR